MKRLSGSSLLLAKGTVLAAVLSTQLTPAWAKHSSSSSTPHSSGGSSGSHYSGGGSGSSYSGNSSSSSSSSSSSGRSRSRSGNTNTPSTPSTPSTPNRGGQTSGSRASTYTPPASAARTSARSSGGDNWAGSGKSSGDSRAKGGPKTITPLKNGDHIEEQNGTWKHVGADGKVKEFRDGQGHATVYNGKGEVAQTRTTNAFGTTTTNHHPDGTREVTLPGGRTKYTEHTYQDRSSGQYRTSRTYVNNVTHTTVVRNYNYINRGGYSYHVYQPVAFVGVDYGYFGSPWGYSPGPGLAVVGVPYHWGYVDDPWYPTYGYYFRPRPLYLSALDCIADGIFGFYLGSYAAEVAAANAQANLQAQQNLANANAIAQQNAQQNYQPNYPQNQGQADQAIQTANQATQTANQATATANQATQDANAALQAANNQKSEMSDEIKKQVAIQVQQALDDHKAGQTASIEDLLKDPTHVHLVAEGRQVLIAGSQTACKLGPDDSLKLDQNAVKDGTALNTDDGTALMRVISSQIGDCAPGLPVTIDVNMLQEYQNSFVQSVEEQGQKVATDHPELKHP